MSRRPPSVNRTDTLLPRTTAYRSVHTGDDFNEAALVILARGNRDARMGHLVVEPLIAADDADIGLDAEGPRAVGGFDRTGIGAGVLRERGEIGRAHV